MPGLPHLKLRLRRFSASVLLHDKRSITILMLLAAMIAAGAFIFIIFGIVFTDVVDQTVQTSPVIAPDTQNTMEVQGGAFILSERLQFGEERGGQRGIYRNSATPINGRAVTLPDAVRQVDVALLQTLEHLQLPPADLVVLETQTRFSVKGVSYPYLRLNIPSEVAQKTQFQQFTRVLRESLQKWESRAVIRTETDLILIQIDGCVTHSLVFGGMTTPLPAPTDEKRAWMCIIMDDVGEDMAALKKLLALPYPVTISIWPYSTHAAYSSALATARGRQVFIHLPMQPDSEERHAIRPETLRVDVTPAEITQVLEHSRRSVPDAVGLNNHMGSRFTSNVDATRFFCEELRKFWPKALVVDSLTHKGSVFYELAWEYGLNAFRRSLFLDEENTKAAILQQLEGGLDLAKQNGWAIVIGHPRQATLAALQVWQGYLDPEVAIVPLLAIR